jgi:hypothetical protein
MISFGKVIKKTKYAWELNLFHQYRDLSDGLDAFDFKCIWDRYIADHTPRFELSLVLFNYVIFEFTTYNIYHEDNPEYYS